MEHDELQRASAPDQPPQETPEDVDPAQAWAKARTPKQWHILSLIAGAAAGSVCGALVLFFSGSETYDMIAMLAALVIALTAPKIVERRLDRSARLMQIYMMAALGVWLAVYCILLVAAGTPLTANPS